MVLSTSADSNWLADPNSGQILAYPIRATASRLVSASADTHIVINTVATCTGIPNFSKNPATPAEKIENGVPSGFVPFTATAPTTTSAMTPRRNDFYRYDLFMYCIDYPKVFINSPAPIT